MDVVKEWFTSTLPQWLTAKTWVLPNWSWVAIALVVVILIIAIAAICARKRKKLRQEASKPVLMETTAAEAEEKTDEAEKQAVAEPQPEHAKVEEATVTTAVEEVLFRPEEEEPAAVNAEVKEEETAVPENKEEKMEEKPAMAEDKPATKPAAKAAAKNTTKTESKPAEKKAEVKPAAKPVEKNTEAKPAAEKAVVPAIHKADNDEKVYHISKRREDHMWQVKAEGSSRALKKFFTQEEAVEYAKNVAKNNDGRIVIHKVDGSFKKLKY